MTKLLSKYKAVFFDAGDTLITIPAAHEIMQVFLTNYELQIEQNELQVVLSEAITQFYYNKKDYTDEAITPESDRAFWVSIYQFVLERLEVDHKLSHDEIHRCCHELYDVFVSPDYYSLFSDVHHCLDRLQQMGLRLGLISNFAPTLRQICAKHKIDTYFDPLIVSTEVGLEKPNPEIFSYAMKLAGLRPEDVLYIGDHEINDVWAPQQIGMDAIRIIRYEGVAGEGIHSLDELFELERIR